MDFNNISQKQFDQFEMDSCVLYHVKQDLKPIINYVSTFKKKINSYANADDLLFYMYVLIDTVENFKNDYKEELGL